MSLRRPLACAAAGALALALPLGAAPFAAERGSVHHAPTGADAPLAPGYGDLGFELPPPGSYDLPPLWEAADGEVLDTAGAPRSLRGLMDGRTTVLSFMYRSCSDVNGCPLAAAVLQRIRRATAEDPGLARELRLLSLSFDPRRDTPERMAEYADNFRFQAGGAQWLFLTTRSEETIAPILDSYGQPVIRERGPNGQETGAFAHVLRVFLIDREGRIRNIYSPAFLHPDLVLNDVRAILAPARRN